MLKINKAPLKNRLISLTIACLVAGLMWQGFQAIQKEQIIAATNVAKFQALDKLVEIAGALESEINETIKYSDFRKQWDGRSHPDHGIEVPYSGVVDNH